MQDATQRRTAQLSSTNCHEVKAPLGTVYHLLNLSISYTLPRRGIYLLALVDEGETE